MSGIPRKYAEHKIQVRKDAKPIKLDPADALKTSFIMPFGAYCYITMSFGLKNAGATFQRCMQKCLLPQLGRNIHVYVDDIVETFANLCEYRVKLNPEKCVFGVPAGNLLGFLISECSIEENLEKIKAIERMRKPAQLRNVQKFTGCLASVSQFLIRLGERALPLYQLMKKMTPFEWNDQADEAFRDLKRMLSTAPILAAPAEEEPMLLYIAATSLSVSTVMVVERPEKAAPLPGPGVDEPSPGTAQLGPGAAAVDPAAAILNPAAAVPNPGAAASGSGAADPEPAVVAIFVVVTAPSWALPISEFLENGVLPMDETEARQVQCRASAYNIINNELVKRNPPTCFSAVSSKTRALRVGPFKTARSGMNHLLVAVDKFTMWIEARTIKKLDGTTAVRFVKDIAVSYGMLNSIIMDKGTNFTKGALAHQLRQDLWHPPRPSFPGTPVVQRLGRAGQRPHPIRHQASARRAAHPLARQLVDELPAVLWSLRTMPNRSTGFTPCFLVYGAEAVISTDVEFDSPRVAMYTEAEAKEVREDGVDLLEEARLLALNRKAGQHKLPSPWEGPFIASKALCDRNAHYLIDARKSNKRKRDTADEETTRTWNAELLRPFYS
ncbi:uncharacterized protein [Aegilops tauschii subsp. strangulata]|uniref:uncharacterized protein n=1 Tax=Aegilops tauschii subsp. strangulata TaxID=200361 RepID=UPI003CC884C6